MGGLRVNWRRVPCRYLASGVGVQVGERGSLQLDTGHLQVSENENAGVLGSKVIQHKPDAKQPEPVHDVGEELAAHIHLNTPSNRVRPVRKRTVMREALGYHGSRSPLR